MGPIIRICKLGVATLLAVAPTLAAAKPEDAVDRYAAARIAEIGNRNDDALKGYIKLYREVPESAVLADRIFDSAIRSGDMETALQAVRAHGLRGDVAAEAPLILFADAFRRKNWAMASLAADELSARGSFGFLAPILRAWVNVAQGKAADLPPAEAGANLLSAFYSNDQRIYLQLAAGEFAKTKIGLRGMAAVGGEYVRDLMLRAAPVIAAQGDASFADALMATAMGPDRIALASLPIGSKRQATLSAADGLSALHVRIAAALLEQKISDQALFMARLAVWYAPDSEPATLMLANALNAQGLRSQAVTLVETIQWTSPYWADAVRWRVGKTDKAAAVVLARDALKRWPKSPALALLTAQTQEAAGSMADAAKSYRDIVDNAAQNGASPRQRAHYHLMLASVLDNAGAWSAARTELDAALFLDPHNIQVLNYLGYSLIERNQELPRAVAMVRKAFELAPDSPAITDSMGWAYYQTGEFDQAVPLLERAAKASGNDLTINEHLGDAYWRSGRLLDARYAWRVALQTAENEAALRLSGKIDTGLSQP